MLLITFRFISIQQILLILFFFFFFVKKNKCFFFLANRYIYKHAHVCTGVCLNNESHSNRRSNFEELCTVGISKRVKKSNKYPTRLVFFTPLLSERQCPCLLDDSKLQKFIDSGSHKNNKNLLSYLISLSLE